MLVKVNINRLKSIRISRGYTCHRLSIESGLGKNAVGMIESGECKKSSSIRVASIAKQLEVNMEDLILKDN